MLQSGLSRAERVAPVPVTSRTDRLMARIALVIVAGGLVYGFYSLGGPIWWKFYATVIYPYQDHVQHTSQNVAPVVNVNVAKQPDVALANAAGQDGGTRPKLGLTVPDKVEPQATQTEQKTAVVVDPSPSPPPPSPPPPSPPPPSPPPPSPPPPSPPPPSPPPPSPPPPSSPPPSPSPPPPSPPPPSPSPPPPSPPPPSPSPPPPVKVETPKTQEATNELDFNPEHYPLTKERVEALLQDGLIMITWANHHYLDFAKTWVYNLRKVGVTGYMVGAMDDDMLRDLVKLNIHAWRMNTGITKRDLGWGSQNFHLMGRFKIKLIRDVLALGVSVVVSDIDTAWVKNPLPYFHRYPEADILTSTDQLSPTVKDDSLERFPEAGSAFNIGIMLFRPNSKAFVEEWVKSLEDPRMWDQTAFNDLSRKGHGHSQPPKNLWKGYNGQLTVGVLPCALFASGHTFFVQHKYAELGLEPYVAHATFQYSGTPGKRHRFREAMLFDDPPEYYDHPTGFVGIEMDLPQVLLDNAAKPIVGQMTGDKLYDHFALVHHQLFRLRGAIAVALITGRAVVLPPIWCQLDKYWAPLWDGNIPGTHWKKPFICPADHVLDLEGGWFPDRREFGPHLEYREYSFFNNPRMSKAVNESRVVVEVCKPEETDCAKGDAPAPIKDGVIRLAPMLTSAQIAKALEGVANKKIITIRNAAQVLKEFSQPDEQARYINRLNHYASVSCCLQEQPGWMWYDFFADQPHADRFGRKFTTWRPKHGDTDRDVAGYNSPAAAAATRRRSLLEELSSLATNGVGEGISARQYQQQSGRADGGPLDLGREQQLALGLPRRLQSEEAEKLQEVRFLRAMEVEAMFSAP